MRTLYNFLVYLSYGLIRIAALFSGKLRLFIQGRRHVFKLLEKRISKKEKTIWFHCASLGEYEQGLPVLKEIRKQFPEYKTVLTFFSPSGYEVKKNTTEADVVTYLPVDTKSNARKFVNLVQPEIAVFVKYEFWPNYLFELKKQGVKIFLISGLFRKEQMFFKPYGSWMRRSLKNIDYFFVQNNNSRDLLEQIGIKNVTVSGDTRFDRVSQQLEQDNHLDFIEEFKNNSLCIVAGSTWPEDEILFLEYLPKLPESVKVIIAPHNIKRQRIEKLKEGIKLKTVLYSEREGKDLSCYRVLIVDTVGLLSRVYSYADIAYVGGAMGNTGLHNILEPATFGVPVVIGKNYKNFPEAGTLRQRAGLYSVADAEEFGAIMEKLVENKSFREKTGMICGHFITRNTGATRAIIEHLKQYI